MAIEKSAKQVVACLGIKQGEQFTVIGDSTTRHFIELVKAEMQKHGQEIGYFTLDNYQRPLTEVPAEITESARNSSLVFYAIDKVGDELAFRKALNKTTEENGLEGRVGSMLSVTPEVILSGFNCDMNEVKELTSRLKDYMENVSSVQLTTPIGTDLTVEFNHSQWAASTGFIERKKARNVMPAEVYTHPSNANGTVFIDGVYRPLTTIEEFKKDMKATLARLRKSPIYWKLKDGKVVDVKCGDSEIEKVVRNYVFKDVHDNTDRLGEWGMGTNIGMKECLGNLMHDEKFPGIHLAHGHGYSKEVTGCDYTSSVHEDSIVLNSTVRNIRTGKLILANGRYLI